MLFTGHNTCFWMLVKSGKGEYFLEKEDDPRPLHLGDAYAHFINYSHGTLQSNTTVRLKPPSKHLYPADEGAQIAWA